MRKRMLILPALAVVLAFALVAVDTAEGAIIKGPYLMYEGSATEMTVLWQLDNSTTCTIEWGPTQSYGTSDITDEYGDHQHIYTITGLSPGTKYYYQVVGVGSGSFTTAPAGDATDVKFLAFGDTRAPGGNQEPTDYNVVCNEMLNTILADAAYQTMALHVGDWIYENTEHDWDWFFDSGLTNALDLHATVPIQGCIGNHEGAGTIYEKYYPYPYVDASRFYWSFDYGPVHIAIVDQYTSFGVGSTQYNWLENDLATSTKQWKIIVLHQPGWNARSQYNSTVRDDIQPLCEAYGVDIVFGGHAHFYSRCDVPYLTDATRFVHHITTGGGGAPLADISSQDYVVAAESTLQFCEIDIQGDELTLVSRRVSDGGVIDTFRVSHVDTYPPTASLLVPEDNGGNDLDPDDGEVTVNTTQSEFDIQLSDAGDGIDYGTVTSAAVALTRDSVLLVEGTDYSFSGAGSDVITLTGAFDNGLYVITLSGIADLADPANVMAATTLSILIDTSIVPPVTLSFQQGVDSYTGMVDTMIRVAHADQNFADSATQYYGSYQYQYNADTDSSGGPSQVLMRFDSIIGPSQIPAGSAIVSATLRIRSTDDGNGGKLHRMLQAWVDTDITWNNSFGSNGIQADDSEAAVVEDDGVPSNSPDTDVDLDVTATVQDLADGTAVNNGWAILPNGTNGWHMAAAEHPTLGYRPELIVTFTAGANQAPVVNITSPTEGATFAEYDNITITADASDADGTVTTVEFYEGGNKLGEATATPYSYTWNGVPAGSYILTAKATDDEYLASISAPVSITVNPPNSNPVAINDTATTEQGTPVDIYVLLNDSDADGDTLHVASVTNGTKGSVVNKGNYVTYEPDPGFVGIDTFTYVANDGSDNSNAATVTVTVTAIEDTANSDILVTGTPGGSYVDTQVSDGVYQTITEKRVKVPGGDRKDRSSMLEHKWTINVTGGSTITFNIEAHQTASDDGDEFAFAWSTDDVTYEDMLIVTQTADEFLSCALPDSLIGTVYIRVADTNRDAGNTSMDTISIDHMYIRCEGEVQPDDTPPTPDPMTWASVPQATGSDSVVMTAQTASDPSGVEYLFVCTSGNGHNSGWQDSATYLDTGLAPETEYTYTVTARDKSVDQNETAPSVPASATTAAVSELATDPTPSDDQMDVNRKTVVLSWLAGTGANSHDVYLGTSPTLTASDFKGNQTETTYKPSSLSRKTTYYWRIDEVNTSGTAGGVVWSFTTK